LRTHAILLPLMLLATTAAAQAPAEAAAYKKVGEMRSLAMRLGTPLAIRAFHPTVYLWLGDLLKDTEPRKALEFYRRSTVPDAGRRAADLAFRYDPPPPLQIDRWVGTAADPTRPDGRVTLLFFYSAIYPSANPLTRRVEALLTRLGPRGLRTIGVASVLDDHRQQTPDRLVTLVRKRRLPFPVGIDRQRDKDRSVSLALYRGKSVPWGVFLDRYGRIVWLGPLPVEINVFQRCEAKLQALLSDPSYDTLFERIQSGNDAAVRKLGSIKTVQSVSVLFRLRAAAPPKRLRPMIDAALRAVLPRGMGPGDRRLWEDTKENYRYSFEADRLIKHYPRDRIPMADDR